MRLLQNLLHRRIGLVVLTLCVSVVSIGVSLWWNAQLSRIINTVSTGGAAAARTVVTACATLLLSAGLNHALGLCSGWTCETLAHDLRLGYARHFAALDAQAAAALNAGEALSALQNEINDVSGFLRANLFSIVDDLIRFLGTFAWLLWLNPLLTLTANLPVVLLMGYTVVSSRIIGRAAAQSQQANLRMNGFADTLVTVFPVLRLFDAAPLLCTRYGAALTAWEATGIREERVRARLMSLSALLSCTPLLLLFWLGGAQVIRGTMSLGVLYVFINLSGNVSGVMMNIPGRIAQFRRFAANMQRLAPRVSVVKP